MAFPLIAGLALGSGGVSSVLGSGGISSLLSTSLSSITSNPIGALQDVAGTATKAISSIFGGGKDYILADREDIVLGNGNTALVVLYNHPAKQGGKIIITEPMEVNDMFFNGANWHDCISAIEVAKGASIKFYEHPNFGGLFDGLNGDNLKSMSNPNTNRPGTQNSVDLYNQWGFWNDRISSFKVTGVATYGTQNFQKSTPTNNTSTNTNTPLPYGDKQDPNAGSTQNYVSSNATADNTQTSATSESAKGGSTWLWIVLGLLGFGIYTKKIKL